MARAILDAGETREVPFGAYARRLLRRRILFAGLGLLLLAGAWVLYRQLRPDELLRGPNDYRALMRCTSCGREWTQNLTLSQRLPIACPKCGALTALPVWVCHACGHEFVPDQTGGTVLCPNCRSDAVGSAAVQRSAWRPGQSAP